MGTVPAKTNVEKLITTVLEQAPSAVVQKVSSDKLQIYLCFICLKEEKPTVLEALREFSFSIVSLGDNRGTAAAAMDEYAKRIEELKNEINELKG